MFTSKVKNSIGVYMLRNTETNESYIGKSADLARRLDQHRTGIKYRTKGYPSPLLAAFPDVASVEFRVLEFIPIKYKWDGDMKSNCVSRATMKLLSDREKHWIRSLRPSLNKRIYPKRIAVESLPYGAPLIEQSK